MTNIKDLNIHNEVLPIFDYSLNSFTKNKIIKLLEQPLQVESKIIERQNILKGFINNKIILENYSYTVIYLNEVHFFLNSFKQESIRKKRFIFSAPIIDEIIFQNKIHQLILLFHKLESFYFSRINLIHFPEIYRKEINRILAFLSFFELKKYELKIRNKQLKNKDVKELTAKISKLKLENKIEIFWEDLFSFECYLSISKAISNKKFIFPTFHKKDINLTDLYHPLIKNPVKNNFKTSNNVIVLNGPNMSGKSTFLKSISLCIYLGNLGLGIPASRGVIPFCSNFSIGINKRDSILNGYSHFMTEIMDLKNVILKAADHQRCLGVFDELLSGTNIEDALEICTTRRIQ